MSKRNLFLIGFSLILIGALLTIFFDLQPFITSTVTLAGLGIISVIVVRSVPTRDFEEE